MFETLYFHQSFTNCVYSLQIQLILPYEICLERNKGSVQKSNFGYVSLAFCNDSVNTVNLCRTEITFVVIKLFLFEILLFFTKYTLKTEF